MTISFLLTAGAAKILVLFYLLDFLFYFYQVILNMKIQAKFVSFKVKLVAEFLHRYRHAYYFSRLTLTLA